MRLNEAQWVDFPDDADPSIFGPALAWWRRARQQLGRLPARSDLGPEHLTPRALPHTLLVDISPSVDEMRFRLVGTQHVAFNQRDFTGLTLEEVYPAGSPVLAYIKGLYTDLCRVKRPLWSVNLTTHPRTEHRLVMRRLMLPLSLDGETVSMSLAVQTIETTASNESNPIQIWHHAPAIVERERLML